MSEIRRNRGNRRRRDRLKSRHKYSLVQSIWGDAKTYLGGVLGKYDKGKIHDIECGCKTNGKTASVGNVGCDRLGNNYSHSDKKKVECCNSKLKDYDDGWHEIDAMIIADCEDYTDSEGEKND